MEERRSARVTRASILWAVGLAVVASAIGIVLGLSIHWFPVQGSSQARKIDTLYDVLMVFSVPIFVGVVTMVLYCVRTFRKRPGEEELDGPPIHGNTRLEIIWTAIPAVLLFSLCAYAGFVLHDIEKAPAATGPPELKVDVYGQQFAWTFQYQQAGRKLTTTQLYVPENRSVRFTVHAKDVIHDFWVPAWRMKVDAVPGTNTGYRITPVRLGSYPIVCAELCGLGHAYMRSTAHVMPERAFDAWLTKMMNAGAGPGPGRNAVSGSQAPVDGKTIFLKGNANGATPCASCHQLADAGSPAGVGPDLDAGIKNQTPAQITEDIVDPNKVITPGYPANVMPPNFKQVLSRNELSAVVSYLSKVTHK